MSTPASTPATPAPFILKPEDKAKALANLEAAASAAQKGAGKQGYNPFIYIRDTITPLVVVLTNGTATAEQLKAALAIKPSEDAGKIEVPAGPAGATAYASLIASGTTVQKPVDNAP